MEHDRILMRDPETGEHIPLPDFMRKYKRVVLEYKDAANQIQVKAVTDSYNGLLRIEKSFGALKHDFK